MLPDWLESLLTPCPRPYRALGYLWKLILTQEGKKVDLYDLGHDPFEQKDLARDQPERVAHLRKLLDGWWKGS